MINFLPVNFIYCLITLSIFFKLGLPPFHSWLLRIIFSSPIKIIFLILFLQKFIPIHIIRFLFFPEKFFITIILLTFFLSLTWLKNIVNVRAALILSAWANSFWLILLSTKKIWLLFLIFYGLFLSPIIFLSSKHNINKFASLTFESFTVKSLFFLRFLNLAGLPPFSGFFLKLYILKILSTQFSSLIFIILLYLSLIILFAYLITSFYVIASPFIRTHKKHFLRGQLTDFFFVFFSLISFPLTIYASS